MNNVYDFLFPLKNRTNKEIEEKNNFNGDDFYLISDKEMRRIEENQEIDELNKKVRQSIIDSKKKMKDGLREYVKKMKNKSTYKGWIAHDYPENIKIDDRVKKDNSEWCKMWKDIKNIQKGGYKKTKKIIIHKKRKYKSTRNKTNERNKNKKTLRKLR